MQIISRSISYALQPPLSSEQLLVTAVRWQEILEPMIPIHLLQPTFQRAVKNHKTSFVINIYDLIKNYVPDTNDEQKERQAIMKANRDLFYSN